MIVDKDLFFEIQSKMDFISYDQARGFHDFTDENQIVYFVDDINKPQICTWGVKEKKFKFLSILAIRGESFKKGVTYKDYKIFYSQIIKESSKYNMINIVNNNQYSIDFEIGIRLAGFIRPMAFFDSPLSIIVDLNKENIRKRQWKRQLKAANNNNLIFKHINHPTENDINIFIKMYHELLDRKALRSNINAKKLNNLLLDDNYHLFFVLKDNLYLCGRIIYINDENSYDVYAANSNKAIEYKGTTYFMMESIFDFLKANGVKKFDFGRIGIGKSNSVAEFKSYSGGDIVNYNSSWEYCNNKVLSSLLSVIRSFRSNRY